MFKQESLGRYIKTYKLHYIKSFSFQPSHINPQIGQNYDQLIYLYCIKTIQNLSINISSHSVRISTSYILEYFYTHICIYIYLCISLIMRPTLRLYSAQCLVGRLVSGFLSGSGGINRRCNSINERYRLNGSRACGRNNIKHQMCRNRTRSWDLLEFTI